MWKVANTVLRLMRQETQRVFDRFWHKKGWSRSAAYRWLAQDMNLSGDRAHIAQMELDE